MDCSPLGPSVHAILQERILEWVVIPCYSRSSLSRDQTQVVCTAGGLFTNWASREAALTPVCRTSVFLLLGHQWYVMADALWYAKKKPLKDSFAVLQRTVSCPVRLEFSKWGGSWKDQWIPCHAHLVTLHLSESGPLDSGNAVSAD